MSAGDISINGLRSTFGIDSGNLSLRTLCGYGMSLKANMWAKYRPTGGGLPFNQWKDSNNNDVDFDTLYNIVIPQLSESDILNDEVKKWTSNPNVTYCRLRDYDGYIHNAECDCYNNSYEFFKQQTIGAQSGVFYNVGNDENDMGNLIIKIVQTQTADVFTLKEILSKKGMQYYKLGLAFVVNGYECLLSTGKSLYDMLNQGNTNVTYNISISKDGSNYTVGSILYGSQSLFFWLKYGVLATLSGISGLFTDNAQMKVRAVLLEDNSTPYFSTNSSYINAYSLDCTKSVNKFLQGVVTLKRLQPYVNVVGVRNDGDFFGGSDYTMMSDYEYTNGNWQPQAGTTPSTFSAQCYMSYVGDCSINGTAQTNGAYYKYKLNLGGYVCCEFRPTVQDPQNVNEIYLFGGTENSVNKSVGLYLERVNDSTSNDVWFQVDGYTDTVVHLTSSFWVGKKNKYNYINSFTWNSTNVSTNDNQLLYCNKAYGNESGNYSNCHSELMEVDVLRFNYDESEGRYTFSTDTSTNDVYVWVVKGAVSNASSFKLKLMYKGVSETKLVDEICVQSNT